MKLIEQSETATNGTTNGLLFLICVMSTGATFGCLKDPTATGPWTSIVAMLATASLLMIVSNWVGEIIASLKKE